MSLRTTKNNLDCVGKRKYPTFILANKVCKRLNHKQDRRVEIYRCQVCGGYHIGGI